MTKKGLLLRLAVAWSVAGALLALAQPPAAGAAWPPELAAAIGVAAGGALYAGLARRLPRPAALRLPLALMLVVGAGAEEVVWRWFALAEVAPRAGAVAAVAATALAFAALHRNRNLGHVLAGGLFGTLFVATGTVVAAWAAHAAYNLLVAGSIRARATSLAFSDTGAGGVPE